ncbi:MAG: hypothetical protein ACRDIL_13500, partial [Candidatus Limnocylindrales bacterium]
PHGGATGAPADATDDTESWNPPLSGWDFDLSEWPSAKALWDALQAEERGEPLGLRDDPDGAGDRDDEGDGGDEDDPRTHRRSEGGDGEHDGDGDGVTDRPDVDDAEGETGLSD